MSMHIPILFACMMNISFMFRFKEIGVTEFRHIFNNKKKE